MAFVIRTVALWPSGGWKCYRNSALKKMTTEEETVSAVKLLAGHGYYLADYNKEF